MRVALAAAAVAVASFAVPAEAGIIIDVQVRGNLVTQPGCGTDLDNVPCQGTVTTPAAYDLHITVSDQDAANGSFGFGRAEWVLGNIYVVSLSGNLGNSLSQPVPGSNLQFGLPNYGYGSDPLMFSASVAAFTGVRTPVTFALTDVTVTPVPEAGTWGMIVAGFAALGWALRRRNGAQGDLRAA